MCHPLHLDIFLRAWHDAGMSGLFGSPKAPKEPDPNALPDPKSQDESLLTPGADADLDPQAQLARDQATANALAMSTRASPVTLRAPYIERARAEIRQREEAEAAAAADRDKRREDYERRKRELEAISGPASA